MSIAISGPVVYVLSPFFISGLTFLFFISHIKSYDLSVGFPPVSHQNNLEKGHVTNLFAVSHHILYHGGNNQHCNLKECLNLILVYSQAFSLAAPF